MNKRTALAIIGKGKSATVKELKTIGADRGLPVTVRKKAWARLRSRRVGGFAPHAV